MFSKNNETNKEEQNISLYPKKNLLDTPGKCNFSQLKLKQTKK